MEGERSLVKPGSFPGPGESLGALHIEENEGDNRGTEVA